MNFKSKISAFVVFTMTLMFSSAALAYPSGPDGAPWKASADVVGTGGSQGIVVTDATAAGCAQQFSDAMANHYIYHGWEFENIQYCSYNPWGPVVGEVFVDKVMQEDLDTQIADLEAAYDMSRFVSQRDKLIRLYRKRMKKAEPIKDTASKMTPIAAGR
jgi:hypothetical protein